MTDEDSEWDDIVNGHRPGDPPDRHTETSERTTLSEIWSRLDAALVEAKHKEAVYSEVFAQLSAVFDFVWVGELDVSDWSFEPKAGSDEQLAEILSGDGELDDHPSAKEALTSGVVSTVTLENGSTDRQWAKHATDHGYKTIALVPIAHEESTYGILALGRPDRRSLTQGERNQLSTLGKVVGRAITGLVYRKMLMGGQERIVEFRIRDALDPILGEDYPDDVEIQFERTIQLNDEELLQYVTVTGMAEADFRRRVEAYENVSHIRKLRGGEQTPLYETIYTGRSIITQLVDHNARIVNSRYEGGDHYTVAVLPAETDVTAVVEHITDMFSTTDLVAQRAVREERTSRSVRTAVEELLTDKQQAAVESAFAAGYFQRPRLSTGEEVSSALGISKSTFSQHLRAAHRKMYGEVFGPLEE